MDLEISQGAIVTPAPPSRPHRHLSLCAIEGCVPDWAEMTRCAQIRNKLGSGRSNGVVSPAASCIYLAQYEVNAPPGKRELWLANRIGATGRCPGVGWNRGTAGLVLRHAAAVGKRGQLREGEWRSRAGSNLGNRQIASAAVSVQLNRSDTSHSVRCCCNFVHAGTLATSLWPWLWRWKKKCQHPDSGPERRPGRLEPLTRPMSALATFWCGVCQGPRQHFPTRKVVLVFRFTSRGSHSTRHLPDPGNGPHPDR
jgi:hypothetical protein